MTPPDELLPLSPQVFHILIALAAGDQHGYSIMQDVAARTKRQVTVEPGHPIWLRQADAGAGLDC